MANISELIKNKPEHLEILNLAGLIGETLNMRTYLVGGYVRDALLQIKANDDIDIMVEGDSHVFSKKLAKKLNINKIIHYEKFKTVLIPHKEFNIEIASARAEKYKSNSRKPDVIMSTIEQDISRRDFTINSLAVSILPHDFGNLYDPFNGIRDLNKKLIITPLDPDKTFIDDPLRMLRACRFSSQLNFDLAPNVSESISINKERIKIISQERIRDEIFKCLQSKQPSIAFYAMKKTGLLKLILPEIDNMPGIEIIDGMAHKDVFIHTLQVVDNAAKLSNKMELRFAALVHDIAKPITKKFYKNKGWTYYGHDELGVIMIDKMSKRLKISKKLTHYLQKLTKLHLRPIALAKEGVTDSAVRRLIMAAKDEIDDLMILCRADITTKNKYKVKQYLNNFQKVEDLISDVKFKDEAKSFKFPISGNEIMKVLNLRPSKKIGEIKTDLQNAIIDGKITNDYQSAYKYILKYKKATN